MIRYNSYKEYSWRFRVGCMLQALGHLADGIILFCSFGFIASAFSYRIAVWRMTSTKFDTMQ